MTISQFQKEVWNFYKKEGRHDLPWRKTADPYRILVSEVMLQQTQVSRVLPKYKEFLKLFPTAKALADASLSSVLLAWSGLGYNRRALYLQRAAQTVMRDYKGKFPTDPALLEQLPGVGPYTAKAVATFCTDRPYIFIETNIRSVFIHYFFTQKRVKKVSDEQIASLIKKSLPKRRSPKEWYWALMDIGAHLKKTVPNPGRKSASHSRQSPFAGSLRQMRGEILRVLAKGPMKRSVIEKSDQRAPAALASLVRDELLKEQPRGYISIRS